MNGYHKEFIKNVLGIQGHISIVRPGGAKFTGYKNVSDQVEKLKGVDFVAPIIIEQAMFISKKSSQGGVIRGIEPEKLAMKPMMKEAISDDVFKMLEVSGSIIVGNALAKSLGVNGQ